MTPRFARRLFSLPVFLFATSVAGAAPIEKPTPRGVRPGAAHPPILTLGGRLNGTVADVEVAFPTSEVVTERQGAATFAKKHLGALRFPEVGFSFGANTRDLPDVVGASWAATFRRMSGLLIIGDVDFEFFNALVTEVGMPALDAGGTDKTGLIAVKLSPEYARTSRATGTADVNKIVPFSTSSFAFELDGIAAEKVVRIDAYAVKVGIVSDTVGDARDYLLEPGKVDFPNLAVYLRETDATSFAAWHEDFVIAGNCTEDKEKGGRIEYRAEQGKPTLAVKLFNVGIFGMTPVVLDGRKLLRVDLYVERMELERIIDGGGPVGASKDGAASPPKRTVDKRRPVPGKLSTGKVPKR